MEGRGYGDGDEIEDEKTNAESRRRGGTKRSNTAKQQNGETERPSVNGAVALQDHASGESECRCEQSHRRRPAERARRRTRLVRRRARRGRGSARGGRRPKVGSRQGHGKARKAEGWAAVAEGGCPLKDEIALSLALVHD